MPRPRFVPFLLVACALGACAKQPAARNELDDLDRQLTGTAGSTNQADPVIAAALHAPLMTDPALSQSANAYAVRPPPRPDPGAVPPDDTGARPDGVDPATLAVAPAPRGDCPDCRRKQGALTLGELARRQSDAGMAACAARLGYSAAWANRLSDAVPLYPDARVIEAAGAADCGLRVVSFATTAPPDRVINWYYTKATRAGYEADHQAMGSEHRLGGTQGRAAFMLYVDPRRDGGSDVDLVTNDGR